MNLGYLIWGVFIFFVYNIWVVELFCAVKEEDFRVLKYNFLLGSFIKVLYRNCYNIYVFCLICEFCFYFGFYYFYEKEVDIFFFK